jgi:hypothetical protein
MKSSSWYNQQISTADNEWLRFDCTKFRQIASTKGTTNVAAEIFDAFNGITSTSRKPRLVLHLTIGHEITDTRGHYIIYWGDGNVTDPFDPYTNSWVLSPRKIPFADLNIPFNSKTEKEYIFFLVNPDAEFINLGFGARTGTDIVDANKCRETEDPIMAAFIAAPEKCPGPIMYVGGPEPAPEPDYIKKDNSKKRGRAGGGKTNTKKKYRAKTVVSTNKHAKRHRIRRSRRKSQGNRINNGKH